MVKYTCYNCGDQDLGSHVPKVITHIWLTHGIEISRKWESVPTFEDAVLTEESKKKTKVTGFVCEDCGAFFRSIPLLLRHLDSEHGVHIWYVRGLSRKRVFFDGILEDDPTKEEKRGERKGSSASVSLNYVPLSKRPFEPRKKDSEEENV